MSASESTRVCGRDPEIARAYCGRKNKRLAFRWADVTCPDCLAAQRADEAARS